MTNTTTPIRTYRFRLRPTAQQEDTLNYLLRYSCRLYNLLLGMRIEAYKHGANHINFYDQCKEITHLRDYSKEHKSIWLRFQRGVAKRVDDSYKRFFTGQNKFPKFQSSRRYKSLTIPDTFAYSKNSVRIKGLGDVLCVSSRKIAGKIKCAVIKKDAHGWRIAIVGETVNRVAEHTGGAVGIDVGIASFLTTSEGEKIKNPRLLENNLKQLRILQRAVSRKAEVRKERMLKENSGRRIKESRRHKQDKRSLAQMHWRVAEQRKGFHFNLAVDLLSRYDKIAVENLQVKNMVQNDKLSRVISDVGWSQFVSILNQKAAELGKEVISVDPKGTSQECSSCGRVVPKTLAERVHSCPCGLVLDRDHNAAINILKRAGVTPAAA